MQHRTGRYGPLKKALGLSVGVMVLAMSMAWAGPPGVAGEDSCTTLRKHQAEAAYIKYVMSSIQLNEDRSYTSEAPLIIHGEAPEQPNLVCWHEDGGIYACCHGSFCCVLIDGFPYCV